MLKPFRSKILVARFPLDAPLGRRPGGGGGAFGFCPKIMVLWCRKRTQIDRQTCWPSLFAHLKMLAIHMYACCSPHTCTKRPLRVNKLENWHTNVACSFSSNRRCPTTCAPCRSAEPLPPPTPLDNKQPGFYPPVVATPRTPLPPLKACRTPPPPVTQFPEVSEWIPEWMR